MQKAPNFFRVLDASVGSKQVPHLQGSGFSARNTEPCPACGVHWRQYVGEGQYEVEGGESWTDAVPVRGFFPPFLVSDRVIDGLKKIGATGFEALPARIERVRSRSLRVLPEPRYYYLSVDGQINLNLEASGLAGVPHCPVCGSRLLRGAVQPIRYVPKLETWQGSDVFRVGPNPMWGMLFCTRRVLELARQDHWTNFRFDPMDVVQDHIARWSGIDYLGSTWPPISWYPDSPSAGKTLEEWALLMRSGDPDQARLARIAMEDLGADALPVLATMLEDSSESIRRDAARLLYTLSFRHQLPAELRRRAYPLLPPDLAQGWEPSDLVK